MTSQETATWLLEHEQGAPVFLVGISGCGMACLGHMLLDLGFEVVGSDLVWNEVSRRLADRNAVIHRGHSEAQLIRANPAFVVYSSAIPKDNPEILVARSQGIPTLRRGEVLSALMTTQKAICVAGMHGKTTTTALLSFVLNELAAQPSYAIGGDAVQFAVPARYMIPEPLNDDAQDRPLPWFVSEIDESDGGLEAFNPLDAILLNVDDEHLDYFVSIDRIHTEFTALVKRTTGRVVFCADDAGLAKIGAGHDQARSFGFHPLANYRIELRSFDSAQPSIERFEIWKGNQLMGEFTLQLAGRANVSNATAAIVWLLEQGFSAGAISGALSKFKGVRRRQELVFSDSRYRVIDDYAHHPTEIRETIQAVRRYGPQRLIAVFQPHRYTRTEALMDGFATCFRGVDEVWLTEIYDAHETPIPGVSGRALADALSAQGSEPVYEPSLDRLRQRLAGELRSGDLALFLGAGEITLAAHQLAAELGAPPSPVVAEFVSRLRAALGGGSELRLNEPLAKRTTLRVGGPADVYLEPASIADLSTALKHARDHEVPVFVLGRGSNLLIRDRGIRGLVISLTQPAFSEMIVEGDRIICGAGARLRVVAAEARRVGLTGLEFLEGIPGTLGGALRMNAGAMGSWMFDFVESIKFIDYCGQIHERSVEGLHVEYRGCPLLRSHLAIEAVLRGQVSSVEAVRERMSRFSAKRWESQPAAPSAGCIFKNPGPLPAGKLIDDLGLKGTCVGGASVSEVHGNFIVNDGTASADDVMKLIQLIKDRARMSRGIELRTEVQIVGG